MQLEIVLGEEPLVWDWSRGVRRYERDDPSLPSPHLEVRRDGAVYTYRKLLREYDAQRSGNERAARSLYRHLKIIASDYGDEIFDTLFKAKKESKNEGEKNSIAKDLDRLVYEFL